MVPFGIHFSGLLAFFVQDALKVLTSIKEFFCQAIPLWHALVVALAVIFVLELLRFLKLWQRVLIALAVCLLILLLLNWGQGKGPSNGPPRSDTSGQPPNEQNTVPSQSSGSTEQQNTPKPEKVTVILEGELFTVEVKWEKETKRIEAKNNDDLRHKLCNYLEQLARKFPFEIEVHESAVDSPTSANVKRWLAKLAKKNPRIHYHTATSNEHLKP